MASAVEHARHARGLPPALRWLPRESWHFTLQFLGEVDEARLPELEAAGVAAAGAHQGFEIAFGDAGAFGSARRARIVHLGLSRGADAMAALVATLQAQTMALGWVPEARAFVPHLTLARLRQPADVRPALSALQTHLRAPPMPVRALALMRSHLSQHGARYEPLASALLRERG